VNRPPLETPKPIGAFVDVVTLVYHEARNVRHLISAGFVEPTEWEHIRGQPTNRVTAWKAIQSIRVVAKGEASAAAVESVFCRHFGVSLEDLRVLYENPHWKAGAFGGNRWADIVRGVTTWRDAIDTGDAIASDSLCSEVRAMPHNTGTVEVKLRDLDSNL
jgi:hypothetical protein